MRIPKPGMSNDPSVASMHPGRRAGAGAVAGITAAALLWLAACAPAQAQAGPPAQSGTSVNRIEIAYLHPVSSALKPYEALLKENQVLEHVQHSLSFIELPRPLLLRFAQCNDDNAWHDPDAHTVTFCYELVKHIEDIAPKGRRHPAGCDPGLGVFFPLP